MSSATDQGSESGRPEPRRVAADLWEAAADERDRLADERDHLADEREAIADRHDHALDQRAEADGGDSFDRAEEMARLHRAEAALQRAQANLLRAQEAMTRADAQAEMRTARESRGAAAAAAREATDDEDLAWLLDRRDFVAVDRDRIAHLRDGDADRRDEMADQRERHLDDAHTQERLAEQRRRAAASAARQASAAERASAARQWGPQAYGPKLLAGFADLLRDVFGSDDLGTLIPTVLTFVVDAVPGCQWACVTLHRDGHMVEAIGSDAVAAELDHAAATDGPGLDALRDEYPVHVPRIGDPPRWPSFEAAAARLGVASAMCHGLFAQLSPHWAPLGVLTLYGAEPGAFTVEDEECTLVVAAFLSTAIVLAQRHEQVERREAALHRALSSRDVIGQAKGILMERQKLSAGDAFDLLRRASQRINRKLTEVAEHLAETGELPR